MGDRTCLINNADCSKPGKLSHGFCNKHFQRWLRHGDPLFVKNIYRDDERRFWSKVNKDGPLPAKRPDLGPCWIWTGPTDRRGYGRITIAGTEVRATRFICGLNGIPIPEGYEPDHLCKNTGCVNYESHLEIVTQRENTLRSDNPMAINARKTHCDNGHEFTEANTRVSRRGDRWRRTCRACDNARGQRKPQARKAA